MRARSRADRRLFLNRIFHNLLSGRLQELLKRPVWRRFHEREDRTRRVRAQIYALFACLTTFGYVLWAVEVANWRTPWLASGFVLAEAASFVGLVAFFLICWHPRFHRPAGLSIQCEWTVDVFVTVCGEPFALVSETLRAAAAIDYPGKRVFVLDDGPDPDVRGLAEGLGLGYLTRPGRRDAKAGSLNHALGNTHGELILTIDADQVVTPDIVTRLTGYFGQSRVGFVQSRQSFRVPADDPFGNADHIFYGVMQLGKDWANSAFSCGSGVLYRRTALEAVGGFSTWSLVEDLHTSMNLHAAGWRSVYHDHPLSEGAAPQDIWSAYHQRQQWATDSLRILFWDNPLFRSGLSWNQRLQYAHVGYVYLLAGFAMPLFYMLPVVGLLSGTFVIDTTWWLYALVRLPSLVLTSLAHTYLHRLARSDVSFGRASNVWLGYFPAFMAATVLAVLSPRRRPTYAVTGKGVNHASVLTRVAGTLPQWLLVATSLLSIVYGVVYYADRLEILVINVVWAMWTAEKLVWICIGALVGPERSA